MICKNKPNLSKFSDEKIACVVVHGRKWGDVGELGQRLNTEGAYIYIRIFDDRIEILNPGDLYGNNKLENLGTYNMLEVRNNTIIRLLEETTDIVENRHTGIATMRDEMKKMNLPEPEFETLRGTFKVTFRKEKQVIIAQNAENCTDNFTENCTDNEINLLELLKINPNITQVELSNKLNV